MRNFCTKFNSSTFFEKSHLFLCGPDYVVETDHKPLVPLLSKKDLIDVHIRCQRLLMRLAKYSVKGVYVPGKYLVVADSLFRLQENTLTLTTVRVKISEE